MLFLFVSSPDGIMISFPPRKTLGGEFSQLPDIIGGFIEVFLLREVDEYAAPPPVGTDVFVR